MDRLQTGAGGKYLDFYTQTHPTTGATAVCIIIRGFHFSFSELGGERKFRFISIVMSNI